MPTADFVFFLAVVDLNADWAGLFLLAINMKKTARSRRNPRTVNNAVPAPLPSCAKTGSGTNINSSARRYLFLTEKLAICVMF